MIVRYKVEHGVLWAIYQTCPVHGVPAIEPVAMVGQNKTAVIQTAVE